MDRDLVGGILIAAGAALVVLSLLAEPIGLGSSEGFGWEQILGLIVGAVTIVAGLAGMMLDRVNLRPPQPHH